MMPRGVPKKVTSNQSGGRYIYGSLENDYESTSLPTNVDSLEGLTNTEEQQARSEFRSRLAASLSGHSSTDLDQKMLRGSARRKFSPTGSALKLGSSVARNISIESQVDDDVDETDFDDNDESDEFNVHLEDEVKHDLDDDENREHVHGKMENEFQGSYNPSNSQLRGRKKSGKSSSSTNAKATSKMDRSKSTAHKRSSSHSSGRSSGRTHRSRSERNVEREDAINGNLSNSRRNSRDRVQFGSLNNSSSSSRVLRQASGSREIMPLQIEMADSAADVDAFRRYLSRSESGAASEFGPNLAVIPKILPEITAHRRTIALSHAIMTLALLSASASQLRFVVAYAHAHSYPTLNYFLICTCIVIEVLAGIGYVILSRFNFSELAVEKIHSYLIFGLFIVAVSNVIISAFALDDHVCEVLAKKAQTEQYDAIDQQNAQQIPSVLT